jgi:3-oxoacyl-[acyl-carrier protein] reductase
VTEPSQVVIVSGGSRGLGAGIVEHLLAAGCSVSTFSRRETALTERLSADPELSERYAFARVDASDAGAIRAVVDATHERFGRIDALINNAGVAYDGVLALTTEENIDRMLNVNLRGALLLAKECSRLMLLKRSGVVINISSIIGQRGFSGLAAYSATKAGLDGMTRALARELGRANIRVNGIAPGYLETDMSGGLNDQRRSQIVRRTPLGRLGKVEDVLPVVDFLLSDASAFMTGQILTVDGGSSL